MSESELEEILREVKYRANANATFNTIMNNQEPRKSEPKATEKPADEGADEQVFVLDTDEDEIKPNEDDIALTLTEDENPFEATPKPAERKAVENEGYLDVLSMVDNSNEEPTIEEPKPKKGKGGIIAVVAVIVAIAVGAGAYFTLGQKSTDTKPSTSATEQLSDAADSDIEVNE